MNKKDIENREDLLLLLSSFYDKALHDEVIGHFFTRVIHLNLEKHIPVIADFWETILLNGNLYTKNVIMPHVFIHQLSPIEKNHFDRWLILFSETIDINFEGETAERAKQRAASIATIMRLKLSGSTSINIADTK